MADQPAFEQRLATLCVAFRAEPLPDSALRAAEQCVLDWLGCTVAGADTTPAQAIMAAHAGETGRGPATSFAGAIAAPAGIAALVNGTAAHTIELDDIYSPALYHPGAPVIAAALAASQLAGADGMVFLRSVIAGYELSNRLGAALNPEHYEFWHTTGTVGTLGAALASAVALGLDAVKTAWAVGHAASMAAGLQQAFRSDGMTKPLHAGRAAESGLLAARLADAGLVGSEAMLSGPVGFARAMSAARNLAPILDDVFRDYTIERTTFKRFSACGHTFAPVDAILDLAAEQPIGLGEIRRIDVATYAKAIEVAGIKRPATPFEARFSIPFGVAAALLGHDLTDPTSFDRLHADAAIAQWSDRVSLIADPAISAAFPGLRGARVTLHLEDGNKRSRSLETRKGDPGNPLSRHDLDRKFRRLVDISAQNGRAPDFIDWVRGLRAGGGVAHRDLPIHGGETLRTALRLARTP